MKKRFEINPNNKKRMDEFYTKFNPEKERFNDWMIPILEKKTPKNGSVLEIGCGFGKTLNWIFEKNNSLDIVGSDLSKIAIDKAQIFYPHIKFICEDAETIKHDKQYDLIINSQTLEHVDNPKIIIKNMMKLSKKNGVIFITVPYPNSNLDRGVKLHHWTFYEKDFKDIMGQHTECIKIDKNHLGVIWKNI
jgi:2-polyprenyl-3-methyl-5-hydroxy-6-metoxy-1,4-benzoquinol methylase